MAALLSKACVEEVNLGNYHMSALELSLQMLDVVRDIKSSGDYNSDQDNGDIGFV